MKTKFNKTAVAWFFSYSITLSLLLSVGLMGAFCSGCVRVLNQYSWRAKACRTEGVFNTTEGLGLKSLEILLKNKSVYRKMFQRRIVSQDTSVLSSGATGRVNIPLVS